MKGTASFLKDMRELNLLMRGMAENPLLEQWRIAKQRVAFRRKWWQGYLRFLICLLPCIALYFLGIRIGANYPSMELLGVVILAATGPGLLLNLWQAQQPSLNRIVIQVSLAGLFILAFLLYRPLCLIREIEDTAAFVALIIIGPLWFYGLSEMYSGIRHGLEISSNSSDNVGLFSGQDIRISMLENREILMAFLALHLPAIDRILGWLGISVGVFLMLLVYDLDVNPISILAHGYFAVLFLLSSMIAARLILLLAVNLRVHTHMKLTMNWLAIAMLSFQFLGGIAGIAFLGAVLNLRDSQFGYGITFSGETVLLELTYFCAFSLAALLISLPVFIRSFRGSFRWIAISGFLSLISYGALSLTGDSIFVMHYRQDLPSIFWGFGLILAYIAYFRIGKENFRIRQGLMLAPLLVNLLLLPTTVKVFIDNDRIQVQPELLELARLSSLLIVGSPFAIQSSMAWGDFSQFHIPLLEWWRMLVHFSLQILLLYVMYVSAIEQIGRWRRLEE